MKLGLPSWLRRGANAPAAPDAAAAPPPPPSGDAIRSRNPDAAGDIRGLAIILAAFAEGLGVLAVVVGLLAIFIKPAVA